MLLYSILSEWRGEQTTARSPGRKGCRKRLRELEFLLNNLYDLPKVLNFQRKVMSSETAEDMEVSMSTAVQEVCFFVEHYIQGQGP